jgi:hypothetical protein
MGERHFEVRFSEARINLKSTAIGDQRGRIVSFIKITVSLLEETLFSNCRIPMASRCEERGEKEKKKGTPSTEKK